MTLASTLAIELRSNLKRLDRSCTASPDGLSPLGRGLAAQDAAAKAVRHGQQAEGLRVRGSLMSHAEVAVVPGSHGGFNRIGELNDRIAAFIKAHVADVV